MPLIPDEFIPLRATSPETDRPALGEPGIIDTASSAGTLYNWPYRSYRYMANRAGADIEPDHNPFDLIKGTKYESDPARFAFSRNGMETQAIMREWDEDEAAKDVLGRSGWTGTVASVGMGLLDPTIFLPVAKVFSGVAAGANALRLGADVAIAGGAGAAIGEAAMAATTPDYTAGDVALNIGSATVLGGLLGAGAGALLSRGERQALADTLHADREAWGAEISTQPASAGAAASDTRTLEMRKLPGLSKVPDITSKISPPRRVLNSGFLSARRTVADLVETPYIFDQNVEGVATTQGPALSRLAQLETGKARVGVATMFDDAYSRYRFGNAGAGKVKKAVTGALDLTGRATDGKATFPQFKEMVDDALRNGDAHEISEVAEAAKHIRSNVLTPWRDRAIKLGLLPEDIDVKTADSYMTRVWNKERLIADRPNVVRTFADWLSGEEGKKLQIQTRLQGQQDLLDNYHDSIGKLEAKIASRKDALVTLGAKGEEMTSLNRFAHNRAGKMRGELDDLQDAEVLTGADKAKPIGSKRDNAKGGAVFESKIRDRGNVLADRISGKDAELDDLANRLGEITAKRDRLRADIEADLAKWEGKSAREAKAAMKARAEAETARQAKIDAGDFSGDAGRLASADSAVDAAVRRILASDRTRDRQEIEGLANEIIDRIVGGPDGRLPYDAPTRGGSGAPSSARGALAARDFMIPDNMIRDYLEKDVQQTVDIYLNTMVPDVLLTERFGDVDMTEAFRKLNDEASARELSAKSEKERLKIRAEKNNVEADIAAMRDRLRHTYGYSSDPRQRFLGRAAATAARYDIITNLGGAAFSSLADMAGLQWRYGFQSAFKHAWAPMLKALTNPEARKALAAQKHQLKALGIAAETYLNTRTSGVYDVLDVYKPTSKFERAMNLVADKFGLANLLTPWTDFGKTAAGMVSSAEISRAVEAISLGKAKPRQIRDLAEGGIDAVMADRIWKQLSAEGGSDVVSGVRIPNSGNWADTGARDAFEGMLARDVDIMILTPGAEKPLMMSKPIAALILQYKTFVAAANERVLIRSLQARDAQVLQGLVSAIALGGIAEYAYTIIANRDGPTDTADWVKAGVSRSGVLGWYQEANAISAKWTGGTADAFRLIGANMPEARYISRSPGSALLGPTYGKFEAAAKVMSKTVAKMLGGDQEWTASDTRQMRRMLIGQNLFYIRWLLDAGEDVVNDGLGVEPMN